MNLTQKSKTVFEQLALANLAEVKWRINLFMVEFNSLYISALRSSDMQEQMKCKIFHEIYYTPPHVDEIKLNQLVWHTFTTINCINDLHHRRQAHILSIRHVKFSFKCLDALFLQMKILFTLELLRRRNYCQPTCAIDLIT